MLLVSILVVDVLLVSVLVDEILLVKVLVVVSLPVKVAVVEELLEGIEQVSLVSVIWLEPGQSGQ